MDNIVKKNITVIKKSFFLDLILLALFKILLDYSYVNFVQKKFAYEGYQYSFNFMHYIEGWIVIILVFFLLISKKKNILYVTLFIAYLLLIPPASTLYAFAGKQLFSFYVIVLSYTLLLLMTSNIKIHLKFIKNSYNFSLVFSLIITIVVLLHQISVIGIGNINFDLSKVYELRREYGVTSNQGIFGYLNGWVFKVFNILMISWSLHRKKYVYLLFFVFLQILLFGLAGHKSIVVAMLLLFAVYYFNRYRALTTIILSSFIALFILALSLYFIYDNIILPSIIIRRAFFVPVDLNYIYLDFFSTHDWIIWSDGILRNFIDYPYTLSSAHVVGAYLGHPEMGANTGFIGSGYMNLGLIGILLYIIILALIINLINSFQKIPIWLANGIVLMPLLSALISSDLPTTLLTHGLLVSVLMVYLYGNIKSFGRKLHEQK